MCFAHVPITPFNGIITHRKTKVKNFEIALLTVAKYCDTVKVGQGKRYFWEVIDLNIEKAIRDYLVAHGITQAFIARKCGWTKQRMNAILSGRQKISVDDMGAICETVGVPYDYFYNAAKRAVQESA